MSNSAEFSSMAMSACTTAASPAPDAGMAMMNPDGQMLDAFATGYAVGQSFATKRVPDDGIVYHATAGLLMGVDAYVYHAASAWTNWVVVHGPSLDMMPVEIKIKIFKPLLTPEGGAFTMACVTHRDFKPDVELALLCVSRSIYHIARPLLYQNVFKFDNFASELRFINKPLGSSRCRLAGCGCALPGVWMNEIHLDVGDDSNETLGIVRAEAIEDSLRLMKTNLHVGKLVVHIRKYCFRTATVVGASFINFADALQKIKVSHVLVIMGDGPLYWDLDIFGLAAHMDTKYYPYKVTVPKSENIARSTKSIFWTEFHTKHNVENCNTAEDFMRAEDYFKIEQYFAECEEYSQSDKVVEANQKSDVCDKPVEYSPEEDAITGSA